MKPLAVLPASMGPGSFDPGNPRRAASPSGCEPLQWGRGLSTPEIRCRALAMAECFRASMGPGSFDPGNMGRSTRPAEAQAASMGPGSFDPGNERWDADLRTIVAGLQWGRGLSTPEIAAQTARELVEEQLQWGRGLSTPEMRRLQGGGTSSRGCFNGAGVFRPRKSPGQVRLSPGGRASMGPGSFDPGNAAVFRTIAWASSRFNGAGVFRPRKLACASMRLTMASVLQWGRGLSTPEITLSCIAIAKSRRLQWGRGLSTPEISPSLNASEAWMLLQWGRGLSTPEMPLRTARDTPERSASMGPGSFDPGNIHGLSERADVVLASMGPGSFDPGNDAATARAYRGHVASMGPGSFDPGNARRG